MFFPPVEREVTMPDVIDIPHAIEQAGGSAELARDLFTMLINDLPELKEKLNQAHSSNDAQALWDHTHKIYGSTAYCGVPALREAAKALEEAIKASVSDLNTQITGLNGAIETLLSESESVLAQEWG